MLGFSMPIAAIRSAVDVPSYPLRQKIWSAASSAFCLSNDRGRPGDDIAPRFSIDWTSLSLSMSILYRTVKNNATSEPGLHLLGRNQFKGGARAPAGRSEMTKKLEGKV